MNKVINRIKDIRQKKGFSHDYIAHELEISQTAYSKLEKNETKLSVERLYKIAEILETPVVDLLELDAKNIFHQSNNDNGTFIGNQDIENLYQDNVDKTNHIIKLFESRLKDKDEIIDLLRNKKSL